MKELFNGKVVFLRMTDSAWLGRKKQEKSTLLKRFSYESEVVMISKNLIVVQKAHGILQPLKLDMWKG